MPSITKNIIVFILFLFLIGSNKHCYAQRTNLKFVRIGLEEGLSQNSVQCIHQDQKGFMWFGTQDGLNMFDGYKFTNKLNRLDDENSISHNIVNAIWEDKDGIMWVGTDGGLNRYDRKKDLFKRFVHNPGDNSTISYNSIVKIAKGEVNILWIATEGGGLNKFDMQQEKVVAAYKASQNNPDSISENRISELIIVSKKRIWVGTDGGGLYKFNPVEEKFISYKVENTNGNRISNNKVTSLYRSLDGLLWVGTDNGLDVIDDVNHTIKSYKNIEGDITSLVNNRVTYVYEDKARNIWVGTRSGLSRVVSREDNNLKFISFVKDPQNINSLSDNRIASIYEDKSEVLWVGTYFGGICKYDKFSQKFITYNNDQSNPLHLSNNIVRSITKDKSGKVWVGTNKGLTVLDRENNQTIVFYHKPNDKKSLSHNVVRSVFTDSKGNIWAGTGNGGLNRFNAKTKSFTRFQHNPNDSKSLQSNDIRVIYEDRAGKIWVGSIGGGLACLINESEGQFINYQKDEFNPLSISNNSVNAIHEIENGNLWVGTSGGLNLFDKNTSEFRRFIKNDNNLESLPNNYIKSIHQDSEGRLWIGTGGSGLSLLVDQDKGVFRHFTKNDGMPNNMVYSILEDNSKNLWLSTNQGISRCNPLSAAYRNYDVNDGLQDNEFNTGAYYQSPDGEMFFGGIKGLNIFYPDNIRDNIFLPEVVISDFQLFNEKVQINRDTTSPEAVLLQQISDTKEITLDYTQSIFSLEFAALHYAFPSKNKYSYIMDGFEKKWNNTDANRRFVTYTNLPAGNYIFKVKAANNDGLWNEEITSLGITITPPFWETLWFRVFVVSFIIGSAVVFYKTRINAIKSQKIKLERLVGLRTQEIQDKNLELRSQQEEILAQRDSLEQSFNNVKIMSEIGQEITALLDLRKLINTVYENVNSLMDATGFGVGVVNEKENKIDFVNFIEKNEILPDFSDAIDDTKRLSSWCVKNQKPIVISDIWKEHKIYVGSDPEVTVGELPESLIYLPLIIEEKIIGLLTVQSFEKNAYTEYQLNLLQNLASYLSIALDNANAYNMLQDANQLIKDKNTLIMDSIRYAERIQMAILPPKEELYHYLPDSFVLFLPKDIVSGDFYWLKVVDEMIYVAAVDCTGHGVPGAFMSMIGNTLLNEILDKDGAIKPSEILSKLDIEFRKALRQDKGKHNETMDICLCMIDKKLNKLVYSGAKRPLLYINNGALLEMKCSRKSIGGKELLTAVFEDHEISLDRKTNFYLSTDGFIDQNDFHRKRFGTKKFKKVLSEISGYELNEQKDKLSQALQEHQKDQYQRDDITVIGFAIGKS